MKQIPKVKRRLKRFVSDVVDKNGIRFIGSPYLRFRVAEFPDWVETKLGVAGRDASWVRCQPHDLPPRPRDLFMGFDDSHGEKKKKGSAVNLSNKNLEPVPRP
jgi:hypothetical protein